MSSSVNWMSGCGVCSANLEPQVLGCCGYLKVRGGTGRPRLPRRRGHRSHCRCRGSRPGRGTCSRLRYRDTITVTWHCDQCPALGGWRAEVVAGRHETALGATSRGGVHRVEVAVTCHVAVVCLADTNHPVLAYLKPAESHSASIDWQALPPITLSPTTLLLPPDDAAIRLRLLAPPLPRSRSCCDGSLWPMGSAFLRQTNCQTPPVHIFRGVSPLDGSSPHPPRSHLPRRPPFPSLRL